MNMLNRNSRARVATVASAVAVTAMTVALAPAVAFAAPVPHHRPHVQKIKPIPVVKATSAYPAAAAASSQSVRPSTVGLSPTTATVSVITAGVNGPSIRASAGLSTPAATVVGAWSPVSAGIALAAARGTGSPASQVTGVSVTVLSAVQAKLRGVSGPALLLNRADGGATPAPVAVRIDDSTLNAAFGADYAARLHWFQTSATPPSLQTTSAHPATHTARLGVASTRSGSSTVLTPQVASSQVMMAAAAGPTSSSGTGAFGATPLRPSASWQVSAQTGDFSWTYPLSVPPAPAGPAPSAALQYDSQSVDGETGSTNNQPSDVGEGWSIAGGGSIHRVYTPCGISDGSRAAITGSGDLCWSAANASVSFAGHSGALVQDASSGAWKLEGDDSTRVEYLTGTVNGTTAGDYWRLTTTDGTQYYFGLGTLPSSGGTTSSAYTVPVCGNSTTGCLGSTPSTETPISTQAWQWNLDYVVDPHGNAETLRYSQQTNRYAEKGSGSVAYVRGGQLTEIDYGLRSSNLAATAASAKLLYTYAARCETGLSGEPSTACSQTTPTASYWPDVPWDQNCTSTTSCTQTAPTFWSSMMLSTVTSQVLNGAAFANVNSWALSHSWPTPGDGTSAALWLTQVQRTGYLTGTSGTAGFNGASSITTPATVFNGSTMQNRVWVINGLAPLDKYRIFSIDTDLGAVISVNYSAQQCTPSMVPALNASPQTNTNRCFPAWWTPQTTPPQAAELDWFHKYVVTSVVSDPHTGGTHDAMHSSTYLYTGNPAWRFDQAPGVLDSQRTWSVWAGYSSVEVRTGDPNLPAAQHTTDYTFLQGMDGDPNGPLTTPTSSTRAVSVTASDGTKVTDSPWWAGRVLEQITRIGSSGGTGASTTPVLSDTVTVPWASAATATSSHSYSYKDPTSGTVYSGTLTASAHLTGDSTATTTAAVSTGGNRTETVTSSYDSYGRISQREDATSDAGITCTHTSYATNATSWLLNYPAEVQKLGVACAATPVYPASTSVTRADVISDVATFYDGSTVFGSAPTKGDPTQTQVAIGYTGSTATWLTTATSGYDPLGRISSVTDPQANPAATTSTSYTPASGPLTQTVVTNPKGWTTTTILLPAWGVPDSVTDANGNATTATYDALGRTSQVWRPNRPQASNTTSPSIGYAYTLSTSVPNAIATTIVNGGSTTDWAMYDGIGQLRQTQTYAEGGGIDLVDSFNDSLGQTVLTTGTYYATGTPSTTVLVPTTSLPSETVTTYDGAGRATASILDSNAPDSPGGGGTELWRTSTSYTGADRADVTPPAGGTPSSAFTNSRGKTTGLTQWLSATPGSGTAETTSYSYDPAAEMTGMQNPAGQAWSWTFNVRGQQISATDPSTGSTSQTYTSDGQLATATDNAGTTLAYSYDQLGRKTGEYTPNLTGIQLAGWTYDTATLGKGLPAAATRYIGGTAGSPGTGTAYTTATTGYSTLGSPAAQTVTIGGSTLLANSYTTSYTYAADGGPLTQTDPAEGGLPAEKLTTGYDTYGAVAGQTSGGPNGVHHIVSGISYTSIGQVGEISQFEAAEMWRDFTWDTGSGRLTQLNDTRYTTGANSDVTDDTFSYDNVGNLTSDANNAGAGYDTQCYNYDQQRNLTQAWTPASNSCTAAPTSSTLGGPAPYWTSYNIDPTTGNRTQVINHATTGTGNDTQASYSYPTSGYLTGGVGGPNAVTGVQYATAPAGTTPGGAGWTNTNNASYSYNTDGATTSLPGQTIGYDPENRAATLTVNGQAQTSIYTADGALLLQTDPTGSTAYLGDTILHVASGSSTVTGTRTYTVLGQAAAERDTTTGGPTNGNYYFLDTNQFTNTAVAELDTTTGAITNQRYFDPYGNPRGATSSWTSINSYLNKPLNTLTTTTSEPITQVGARQYDPTAGRFLSVDPVLDPSNPQQDNGYAYGWNNPLSHADPSGLRPTGDNGSDSTAGCWDAGSCTPAHAHAPSVAYAQEQYAQAQDDLSTAQDNYTTASYAAGTSAPAAAAWNAAVGLITEAAGIHCPPSAMGAGCGGGATNQASSDESYYQRQAENYASTVDHLIDADVRAELTQATDELNTAKAALDDTEAADQAAEGGLSLSLKYKPGWDAAQHAAADAKVGALNDAARSGGLRATQVERSGTSAASRYSRAGGNIPAGADIDHTIDLQLGGQDELGNMSPLNFSVNRSLGSQIGWQLRDVPMGTCVIAVTIC